MPIIFASFYRLKIVQHLKMAAIGGAFITSSAALLGHSTPVNAQSAAPESLPRLSTPAISSPAIAPSRPNLSTAPTSPPAESAYRLGAGDIIRVNIFKVEQYSGEGQVLVDGTLNLPLVGSVKVDGLTLAAASQAISIRYAQYLRRPLVTLSLTSRRPLQVGIAGEINRPGSYTLEQGSNQLPRLSQLIETASGTTQSADLTQVQIRRSQNGPPQLITVNLVDLIANSDLSQDLTLRDGDEIIIPTAAAVSPANADLLAAASFAADVSEPINIAIIGEVYRPGPYTLQGGVVRTGNAGSPGDANRTNSPTTVTRAIQVAGGIKPDADIRKVQVLRPTRSGSPQILDVDLWSLLQAGDLQQDAVLQAGDTVFVPVATTLAPSEVSELASASFSPSTIRVNIVGEVRRAGVVDLPPNTPLSQAILAAGGFNNTRARQGSAELVRLNEDGTVDRTAIPVNFAQGINEDNNPLLRNNDVVIVDRNGLASVSDTLGTVLNPIGSLFSIFRFFNIFD